MAASKRQRPSALAKTRRPTRPDARSGWHLFLSGQSQTHLAGDFEVFAGCDDDGSHGSPGLPDVAVALRLVARRIDSNAEKSEAFGCEPPDLRRVLTHAAREDEGVETAHRRGHRGDRRAEPVDVGAEREARVRISFPGCREHLSHVRFPAEPDEPRISFEPFRKLGGGDPRTIDQPEEKT